VICEVFAVGSSRVKKSAIIRSEPRIRVIPNRPRSLDWFLELAPRLENFFSLMLGTSVNLKALQLFQGEEVGWLVGRRRTRSEKVDSQSHVKCSGERTGAALSNWLAVPEDERPVERTLLGMLRVSELFVETEFLSLAQSLEAFGRLRFSEGLVPKQEFKNGLQRIKDFITTVFGASELTRRCGESLSFAMKTLTRAI
jgi:ApeA N-terminal domain 1